MDFLVIFTFINNVTLNNLICRLQCSHVTTYRTMKSLVPFLLCTRISPLKRSERRRFSFIGKEAMEGPLVQCKCT